MSGRIHKGVMWEDNRLVWNSSVSSWSRLGSSRAQSRKTAMWLRRHRGRWLPPLPVWTSFTRAAEEEEKGGRDSRCRGKHSVKANVSLKDGANASIFLFGVVLWVYLWALRDGLQTAPESIVSPTRALTQLPQSGCSRLDDISPSTSILPG